MNRLMIIRGLVWWALYIFLYFTKWAAGWTQNGTRLSYVHCCCFPDLSHVNMQGVKHKQLVIMQRDLSLKASNWNYKLHLTQCDFFTCVLSRYFVLIF